MNNKERPVSSTAQVYFVNKANMPLIEQGEKIAYSEDKQFALTYTEEDIKREVRLIEAMEEWDRLQKRSYEDEIYEIFLVEANVEEYKEISTGYKEIKVNRMTEMLVHFQSSEPFPTSCIFNKLDAIKGGSSVVFVQASANKDGIETGFRAQINDEKGE